MNPYALTAAEERYICQCSIERVVNTGITVAQDAETSGSDERIRELGSISWQDLEDAKPILIKLWEERKNAIFKSKL